jgi:hypothetical protein
MKIMMYFNLRYECLDARDDYSAKRDKDESGKSYQWATSELLNELDNLHDEELVMGETNFDLDEEYKENDIFKIPGNRGKMRQNEMQMAERTMRMVGWLDECEDGLPDVGSLLPIEPEYNQPSKA